MLFWRQIQETSNICLLVTDEQTVYLIKTTLVVFGWLIELRQLIDIVEYNIRLTQLFIFVHLLQAMGGWRSGAGSIPKSNTKNFYLPALAELWKARVKPLVEY